MVKADNKIDINTSEPKKSEDTNPIRIIIPNDQFVKAFVKSSKLPIYSKCGIQSVYKRIQHFCYLFRIQHIDLINSSL